MLDLTLLNCRFAAYEEELRAMASQPYFRFTLTLIIQFTFPLFFLLLNQRKVTPSLYTDHHRSKSQFTKEPRWESSIKCKGVLITGH